MRIELSSSPLTQQETPVLAVGVFEETQGLAMVDLDRALGGKLSALMGENGTKLNQITVATPFGGVAATRILLVGLGKSAELTADKLRQAAGKAAAQARDLKAGDLTFAAPRVLDANVETQAIVEGAILGSYRYDRYMSEKPRNLDRLVILNGEEAGLKRGQIIAEAICLTRDLVNCPPNDLYPESLAEIAKNMAKEVGVTCSVLGPTEMKELGMGGLLGVTSGSSRQPRFIVLEYRGSEEAPIVFVGKGITFDAGGLCLKPRESMEDMKDDMSGAAAVIGAMKAIASLKLPHHVVGLIPACENMPDGNAFRPGDILNISGKTVEVNNTDAEGRLILADALAYAKRYNPKATLDLATLTGACVVALGYFATGIMGNDEALIERIKKAANATSEKVWELPLWPEYTELLKSDIADLKNTGGRWGGAITAGAFLQKFVEGPWCHLDIAGTAREEKGRPYTPKGGSGVGVRLLTELVENWK